MRTAGSRGEVDLATMPQGRHAWFRRKMRKLARALCARGGFSNLELRNGWKKPREEEFYRRVHQVEIEERILTRRPRRDGQKSDTSSPWSHTPGDEGSSLHFSTWSLRLSPARPGSRALPLDHFTPPGILRVRDRTSWQGVFADRGSDGLPDERAYKRRGACHRR